jgi:hypothetical protein
MPVRPRTKPANLSPEQAKRFFESHVPLGANPKNLWSYSMPHEKKNPGVNWPAVDKMKSMLSDLLDLTQGRLIKQVQFTQQLHAYLNAHGVPGVKLQAVG